MCVIISSISSRIDSAKTPVMPQRAFTTGTGSCKKCRNSTPAHKLVKIAIRQLLKNLLQVILQRNFLIETPMAPASMKEPYLLIKSSIVFNNDY